MIIASIMAPLQRMRPQQIRIGSAQGTFGGPPSLMEVPMRGLNSAGCRSRVRGFIAAVALLMSPLVSGSALAAFVTEPNLTPIYSANPPFDSLGAPARDPMTIDWLAPIIVIGAPNLLNINTAAKETALFSLPGTVVGGVTIPTNPTVDVFFVDSISVCGGVGGEVPGFAGCASGIPGVVGAAPWSFAVDSGTAVARMRLSSMLTSLVMTWALYTAPQIVLPQGRVVPSLTLWIQAISVTPV
jgi:hypothetical protein